MDAAASFPEEKDRIIKEMAKLEDINQKLRAKEYDFDQLQNQIVDLQIQLQKQSEESSQAKTDYQVLSIKHQQGQDSIKQLREEIKNVHKESIAQIKKKEAQYRLIAERCKSVLTGHQKFLQQLQQSFITSSEAIDELSESVLTAEDTYGQENDERFYGRGKDRPTIRIS